MLRRKYKFKQLLVGLESAPSLTVLPDKKHRLQFDEKILVDINYRCLKQ